MAADWVARADALRPALAARAEACEAARRVPDESIAELDAAGMFSLLKPARWGGAEAHPAEFFDAVISLAAACPSTAWVVGVVAAHAWQLALFAPEAQDDVWGKDPSARISSSYMPVGRVTRVDGGYRLSGEWGFSSGCDHCSWAMLGAMVPTPEGSPPDMRTFLVPRADVTLVDDWWVTGLSGTGSKTVRVNDAFVPEHRTHRMSDAFKLESPGNALNPAPLYRLPFGQVFTRTVATPAVGMLLGAIDAFVDDARGRVSRADGRRAADDPALDEVVADARLVADEVRATLRADLDAMLGLAAARAPIPLSDRVRYRHHAATVTARSCEAVTRLFFEGGSGAIFRGSRLGRFFRDVHAARAHHANAPRRAARNAGGVAMGRQTTDFFL